MQANMGTIDRVARAVVAVLIVGLIASGLVSGVLAFILGVLAAVFGITSVISFCPLYLPFGITTCQRPVRK
ncbi:MAG: DUF2892 domain-containing protein [Chloroflexales bacterium]|nr:DUF2892 domain-containing protein [Chloroflexales bacterium]